MLGWLRQRLEDCGVEASQVKWSVDALPPGEGERLGVTFGYAKSARFFRWNGDFSTGHALFEADFGRGRARLSAAFSMLAPEIALSEAMFF
jgi:hypothetical protein